MVVGTHQLTQSNLSIELGRGAGRHLGDIVALRVRDVVEVKEVKGLGRHDKSAIHAGPSGEFGCEETGSARGKVALLVMRLTIARGRLGGIEQIGVGGSAHLTRLHFA